MEHPLFRAARWGNKDKLTETLNLVFDPNQPLGLIHVEAIMEIESLQEHYASYVKQMKPFKDIEEAYPLLHQGEVLDGNESYLERLNMLTFMLLSEELLGRKLQPADVWTPYIRLLRFAKSQPYLIHFQLMKWGLYSPTRVAENFVVYRSPEQLAEIRIDEAEKFLDFPVEVLPTFTQEPVPEALIMTCRKDLDFTSAYPTLASVRWNGGNEVVNSIYD
jgi:hypothetical protein